MDRENGRKLDIPCTQKGRMAKCGCGRDAKSFEACSPMGCTTFTVCSGCLKEIESCLCGPT